MHPAATPPAELLHQCEVTFTRRSGPGGQHRNKVQTAVILRHLPTGTQAEANERRSQAENRRVALLRLRLKLALEVRSTPKAEGPSALWRSRCQGGRIAVSVTHEDFPAILAEALDVITIGHADIPKAAERLLCTPSQLLKLLKQYPASFQSVNVLRKQHGLHELR